MRDLPSLYLIYWDYELFCLRIENLARGDLPDYIIFFNGYLLDIGSFHLFDNCLCDLFMLFNQYLICLFINNVIACFLSNKEGKWSLFV